MGGNAGDMLGNIAGRALGVLAALPSRGGGFSNLAAYMARRQAALSDPEFRATLSGSPFASGFYQVGGSEQAGPGTYRTVAAPADFMGPTIPTTTGPADVLYAPGARQWQPNLPPLSPRLSVVQEQQQGILTDLQSGDVVTRARAKMAAGVPLTPEETQAAAEGAAGRLVGLPPGSTISLDVPGSRINVGSPYAGGVYQTPVNIPGRLPSVPAPGGGYLPGPELERGEHLTQQEALGSRLPGEQTRQTARGTWENVKVDERPETLPPLTVTPPRPAAAPPPAKPAAVAPVVPQPAPAPTPPAATPATPAAPTWDPNAVVPHVMVPDTPPSDAGVGYPSPAFTEGETTPAAPAAAPAPPAAAPLVTAKGGVDLQHPWLRQIEAERGLPTGVLSAMAAKESGGDPTKKNPDPNSTASGLFQITKGTAQAWGISSNDRFDPVKSAVATADTLASRAKQVGIERAIGMHYGGPNAPFDQVVGQSGLSPAGYAQDVLRRTPQYAAATPSAAAVVAFPSPAFAEPGAAPTGLPKAATTAVPVWKMPTTSTLPPPVIPPTPPAQPGVVIGPGGTTLEGISQTSRQGVTETFGQPSASDPITQMAMTRLKISDLRTMSPEQSVELEKLRNEIKQRADASEAETKRLTESMTPQERADNELLVMYANQLDALDQAFPDAQQRAAYLDPRKKRDEALKEPFRRLGIPGLQPDAEYNAFHLALAPFSAVDRAKLGPQEQLLLDKAPTGAETSVTEFEQNKQAFRDKLNTLLAWRLGTQNQPRAAMTREQIESFRANQQQLRKGQAPPPPAATPPPPAAEPWTPTWVR